MEGDGAIKADKTHMNPIVVCLVPIESIWKQ